MVYGILILAKRVIALSSIRVVDCKTHFLSLVGDLSIFDWRLVLRIFCFGVNSCGKIVQSSFVVLNEKEATPTVKKGLAALGIQVTGLG